jgi:multiple sugar transport system substrate-binding protein
MRTGIRFGFLAFAVVLTAVAVGLTVSSRATASGTGAAREAAGLELSRAYEGTTITALLPSWLDIPAPLLADFESKTGIKVEIQVASFEAILTKVASAAVSKTYTSDLGYMDGTWVGQLCGGGWYKDLTGTIPRAILKDLSSGGTFNVPGRGQCAVPSGMWANTGLYNRAMLARAGIKRPPTTYAEMVAQAKILKRKKISQYPIGLRLGATEQGSTHLQGIAIGMGGRVLEGPNYTPTFKRGQVGYNALKFMVDTFKAGLVNPTSVEADDTAGRRNLFDGKTAFALFGYADTLAASNDPKQSKVVGQLRLMRIPGLTKVSPNFSLTDGIGISAFAKEPGAAGEFLKWYVRPQTQLALYESPLALAPVRVSVFNLLVDDGTIQGGPVLKESAASAVPLFPQGTPVWYTQFSLNMAAALNAAGKGSITVDQAARRIIAAAEQAKRSAGG